jgi:integrase
LLRTHFEQWFDVSVDTWGSRGFSEACQLFSSTKGAALVETGRGLIGALIKYANAVHGLNLRNPFHQLADAGLIPPRAKPRARRLQEADLPQWFAAVSRIPEKQRDYLLLVLYTGLRRTEATNILKEHCDFTKDVLSVPETKTGRPHALPITPVMREILERRVLATADEKIFGGMSAEHVSSMAERAGAPRFMLHDLRKMFATVGDKIGVRESVLRELLNHVVKKSDTLNRHYVQLTTNDLSSGLCLIQTQINRQMLQELAVSA